MIIWSNNISVTFQFITLKRKPFTDLFVALRGNEEIFVEWNIVQLENYCQESVNMRRSLHCLPSAVLQIINLRKIYTYLMSNKDIILLYTYFNKGCSRDPWSEMHLPCFTRCVIGVSLNGNIPAPFFFIKFFFAWLLPTCCRNLQSAQEQFSTFKVSLL